jgi:hypothetical protein
LISIQKAQRGHDPCSRVIPAAGRINGSDTLVTCQECSLQLPANSPDLRLELTCDDEMISYCVECWEREFGES